MKSFEQLIDDLVQSARGGSNLVSLKPIVEAVAQSYPALTKDFIEEHVLSAILIAGCSVFWEDPRNEMPQSNSSDATGSEA